MVIFVNFHFAFLLLFSQNHVCETYKHNHKLQCHCNEHGNFAKKLTPNHPDETCELRHGTFSWIMKTVILCYNY